MTPVERPLPQWLTMATAQAPAVVDGRACQTRAAFFEETARVLRFPVYFGRNWDALADSLRDATRDRNVALIVGHAEHLFSAEPPEQLVILLAVLAEAAGTGLTVTLCADPAHEAELRHRVATALR
jgi:RNAse (barnase) inhibitor barstar